VVFFLIRFHCAISVSSSRSNVSWVTSSPTVRTITPPESLGSTFCTCSRSRWRSARSPILRLTPTREANGMYTRKRPASDTCAVTRGPLVEIGSLLTWTMRDWPRFRTSWMAGAASH
jgi:hypothetical protein